jgi:lysozyme
MADLIKGIDVSIIQGNIDWQAVANTGVKFMVSRCGVGNNGIDINYAKNIAGAKAVGIKVMAYNFVFPLPPVSGQPLRDPTKQAQYHFKAAQGELAAMDLEWPTPDQWAKWGCSAQQITEWSLVYLQEYKRLSGQNCLVYTYPYFAQAIKLTADFESYPLWIASYETNPTIPKPWNDWVMWQNTGGGGKLPNGAPVDTDLVKDLSLWDAPVVAPVAPVVVPDHQPEPVPVPLAPIVVAPVIAPTPPPPPPPAVPVIPAVLPPQASSIWSALKNFWTYLNKK